jgi:hypothetical protein
VAEEKVKATRTSAGDGEEPVATMTLVDTAGEQHEAVLTPDNEALFTQRAAAAQTDHPANTELGYSNPDLAEATDEEREEDQKAFEARKKATA